MAMEYDAYQGRIFSLANIPGAISRGLALTDYNNRAYIIGNTSQRVLGNNPLRVWALLQNTSTGNIYFSLGEHTASAISTMLTPGGSCLINHDFPWNGVVTAYADVSSSYLVVIEASVQQA